MPIFLIYMKKVDSKKQYLFVHNFATFVAFQLLKWSIQSRCKEKQKQMLGGMKRDGTCC